MVRVAAAEQPPDGHEGVGEVGGVGVITPGWTQRIPDGAPAPGHIHLWAADLAPLRSPAHLALLTPPELARAGRYRDHAQRAMYLGGRVGLRILLGACTGIANADLRFGYGAKGKPRLRNELPGGELDFNYTLSGNKALYALAWNRRVGVDMETWPRKINAALLAKRKLAAVERRAWRAVPANQRDYAMLACWTRKEAYGKALGVGIRYSLNQAPLFVEIHSPAWRCRVTGLFDEPPVAPPDAPPVAPDGRVLHGLQLALPFPGIAALVHDGDALVAPAAGESLRAWRLRAGASPRPAMPARGRPRGRSSAAVTMP